MGSNYQEIIEKLDKGLEKQEDLFITLLKVLTDLNVYSVENYQNELELNEAIKKFTNQKTITFKEILDKINLVDIDLLKKLNTNVISRNLYIAEFINAVKSRTEGTNEENTSDEIEENDEEIDENINIPLDEFAMYLFREFRFYSDPNKVKDDLMIDSIMTDQLHLFRAFHTNNEINIHVKNYYNETLIHLAALENAPQIIEYLTDNGLDIDAQNDFEQTALHLAILNQHQEAATTLIELGANVNIKDNNGNTPFHLVCAQDEVKLTQLILDAKGKVNLKNKEQFIPFTIAIKYDSVQVVELFLKRDPTLKTYDFNVHPLFIVVQYHAIKVFELFKNLGFDLKIVHKEGYNLFHHAARSGCLEICEQLLACGHHVNEQTKDKFTALHLAVINNHQDIVVSLINHGALVNLKNKYDFTPLYYSIYKKNSELTKYLIEQGALINLQTKKFGLSPLHQAVISSDLEIIKLLIENNADLNSTNKKKMTPLHLAIKNNNNDVVKLLLEAGANVNIKAVFGIYPIHLSVEKNNYEITKLLIEHHALLNVKAMFGKSPLSIAASQNNLEITKLLLAGNANPDIKSFGNTPMSTAYSNKEKAVFNYYKEIQTTKKRREYTMISYLYILFSLLLMVYSSLSFYSKIRLHYNGIITAGTILEVDDDQKIRYQFIIDQTVYSFNPSLLEGDSSYRLTKNDYATVEVGQTVQIKYLPNNPWINYPIISTEVETIKGNLLLMSVMFTLGTGYLIYETIHLYHYKKKNKSIDKKTVV